MQELQKPGAGEALVQQSASQGYHVPSQHLGVALLHFKEALNN